MAVTIAVARLGMGAATVEDAGAIPFVWAVDARLNGLAGLSVGRLLRRVAKPKAIAFYTAQLSLTLPSDASVLTVVICSRPSGTGVPGASVHCRASDATIVFFLNKDSLQMRRDVSASINVAVPNEERVIVGMLMVKSRRSHTEIHQNELVLCSDRQ